VINGGAAVSAGGAHGSARSGWDGRHVVEELGQRLNGVRPEVVELGNKLLGCLSLEVRGEETISERPKGPAVLGGRCACLVGDRGRAQREWLIRQKVAVVGR
jgi:hypothetical protein